MLNPAPGSGVEIFVRIWLGGRLLSKKKEAGRVLPGGAHLPRGRAPFQPSFVSSAFQSPCLLQWE